MNVAFQCSDKMGQGIIQTACAGVGYLVENFGEPEEFIERAAEVTSENLKKQQGMFGAIYHTIRGAQEIVDICDVKQRIDKDGSLVGGLEEGEEVLVKFIDIFESKKRAAIQDSRLKGDNLRKVTDAYSDVIESVKNLHDAISNLRWAIMEHDIETERPCGNEFTSSSELIKFLRSA
ncbi:MAG: hypothetical protein AABY83_13665 [Pseudomonadota bacterium]